jgi:signal recognition particle subunit SRP19
LRSEVDDVVSRDSGKWVLWPHYFDKTLTRKQGRRVPADLAIEDPRAGHIAQAAKTLGLKAEIEEEARPPASWHSKRGRVLVPKSKEKKESILKQIARRL